MESKTSLYQTAFKCFDMPASSNTYPNGETITTLGSIVAAMLMDVKTHHPTSPLRSAGSATPPS
jgi:hypothetical protein